mgnify:FL=1
MGAPELLKAEMPLVRFIERELEECGYTPGTQAYNESFDELIAFYRKWGTAHWRQIILDSYGE